MPKASALSRLVASGIAAGVLLCSCGQPPSPPAASATQAPAAAPAGAGAPAAAGPGAAGGAAGRYIARGADPEGLPAGSVVRNPASGRDEVVVPGMRHTALLIGDSQSEPADGWPRLGLAAVGYKVHFCGLGGTGFVAANGKTGNYIDALQRGDWKLPYGTPALVVVQGGGNDARTGATDAQILQGADATVQELHHRYPTSRMLMIGTLSGVRSPAGSRRAEVDRLLGNYARTRQIAFVGAGDWLARYDMAGNLADDVHLTQDGHEVLAGVLATRLAALHLSQQDTAATLQATEPASVREVDARRG